MNNPQDQWWMPGGGLYSDLPTFPYDEGSGYQTEQNLPNPPDWEALQESLLNMLPHNLRNMDDQNITPRQFSPQELPDMLYRDSGPMEPQLAQGGPSEETYNRILAMILPHLLGRTGA